MTFKWPDELSNSNALLGSVGSFWSNVFKGTDLIKSLLYARSQLNIQANSDFVDLASAMSRTKVPISHLRNWYQFIILRSAMVADSVYFVWQLPEGLINVNVITNAIVNNTVTLINGQDFFIQDGSIYFLTDPFTNTNNQLTDIFSNSQIVDTQCSLWLYNSEWDWNIIYEQFGYVLGLQSASSDQYRDLINAVYDGLVAGTTVLYVKQVLAALYDAPIAKSDETVQLIASDRHSLWVITDKNTYAFNTNSTILVNVNEILQPGTTLSDAVKLFEFTKGQVPEEIQSLAVKSGLLNDGYSESITFYNEEVPLEVDTSGTYTKVSFLIGGTDHDVNKFWDDTQTKGEAADQTLAMLLDLRPVEARDQKPSALALPGTINPLEFLLQNVFRNNLFVIKLNSTSFGNNTLDIDRDVVLNKLIPPHTAYIVLEN